MEEQEGEQVMSEVHLGCSPHHTSCMSHFTIASCPLPGKSTASGAHPYEAGKEHCMYDQPTDIIDKHVSMDESGDLVIPRRNARSMHEVEIHKQTISIYHRLKTNIPCVGLQIWKASLLLGDFILHKMQTTSELDNMTGLELGAGTGLLGILLAAKARLVFLTDFSEEVLDNCFRNVLLNSRKFTSNMGTLRIRQLDWQESWPPISICIDAESSPDDISLRYSWLESDLNELDSVSIILAADVIYSDPLTDAFFSLLQKLMPFGQKKVLWLSLEKRYNFSLLELDVVAHGYHYFQSFIEDRTEDLSSPPAAQLCRNQDTHKSFAGKQIQLNQIPQYLLEYERTKDLELWEIWRIE